MNVTELLCPLRRLFRRKIVLRRRQSYFKKKKLGTCTPDEFAYAEQSLKGVYKDEEILDRMDDLLNLFDGVLVRAQNEYPENHPLWVYLEEINAVEKVALEADELLKQEKFIKNPWLGIFDSLAQWRTHLSRKQNQLYPMLEDQVLTARRALCGP